MVEEDKKFLEFQKNRRRKFNPQRVKPNVKYGEHMSSNDRKKIQAVVNDSSEAFSTGPEDIGLIRGYQFGIRWYDENATSYIPPRPIQPAYKNQAEQIIKEWERANIIEEANSPHNSPLFFRAKKDGNVRPILDLRDVNAKTIPNRYPTPNLDVILREVSEMMTSGDNIVVSSMDITAAYTHLAIKESDKEKAAFSFQGVHYQPARMIFGLRNAPSCWSRLMNNVIKGLKQVRVLLDDLIIVTNGLDEHIKIMTELFRRFINIGLTLKPSKCFFNVETLEYLGFELSKKGIKPLRSKGGSNNQLSSP